MSASTKQCMDLFIQKYRIKQAGENPDVSLSADGQQFNDPTTQANWEFWREWVELDSKPDNIIDNLISGILIEEKIFDLASSVLQWTAKELTIEHLNKLQDDISQQVKQIGGISDNNQELVEQNDALMTLLKACQDFISDGIETPHELESQSSIDGRALMVKIYAVLSGNAGV